MTHGLASIFVNNQRVEDLDNPELRIRDIIEAYGRDPERCIVYRLQSEEESAGDRVDLNERVDLAAIRGALHLRCETRRSEVVAPSPEGAAAEAGDEEDLMEFESIPEYEGAAEGEQPFAEQNDEVPKDDLLSPTAGGVHADADPSGHQYYERESGTRWDRGGQESVEPAKNEPSALGSELRNPNPSATQPRRGPRSRRGHRSESSSSTPSTRKPPGRRKGNQEAGERRSRR